jgi:peptidoglycan/LPS O-acetylase OafA/YrhL
MRRWRKIIGTLLLWTPFLAFGLFSLSGVLLGSMGMDIHWTSDEAPYVAATCAVLLVCACVAAGLKLRKGAKT